MKGFPAHKTKGMLKQYNTTNSAFKQRGNSSSPFAQHTIYPEGYEDTPTQKGDYKDPDDPIVRADGSITTLGEYRKEIAEQRERLKNPKEDKTEVHHDVTGPAAGVVAADLANEYRKLKNLKDAKKVTSKFPWRTTKYIGKRVPVINALMEAYDVGMHDKPIEEAIWDGTLGAIVNLIDEGAGLIDMGFGTNLKKGTYGEYPWDEGNFLSKSYWTD